MKRYFILITVFLISVTLFSQSRDSKIFYVNLYPEEVDVRLGEADDYIFKMDALEPYSSTYMIETSYTGTYTLYFKLSSEREWYFWADDYNEPIDCNVSGGKSHCILVGVDGTIEFFTLTEDRGSGPKVSFLNGSNSELTRMEVGDDWNSGTQAFTRGLGQDTITNFVTIDSGSYGLFWQFPQQVRDDYYFYYPDESGNNVEYFRFDSRKYYLFLAYTAGRADYAILYDITP